MAKKDKDLTQDDASSKKIQELEAKVTELEEAYIRARADYANFENRVKQQQSQFIKITTATILSKFMEILDNLEIAAKHIDDSGLDMVIDQIHKLLKEEGVTEVEAHNQEFDPQYMECDEMVTGEKNKVIQVIRKGYWLDKHLIRPAKVTVGNGETQTQK